MNRQEQVAHAIYDAIREINRGLEPEQQLGTTGDTVLIGEAGLFDSMRLVTFLVSVEENVERVFDRPISLDIAAAIEHSPFTVDDMAKHVTEIVNRVVPYTDGQIGASP